MRENMQMRRKSKKDWTKMSSGRKCESEKRKRLKEEGA